MPPMTPTVPALTDTRPSAAGGVDFASMQFRDFYGVLVRAVEAVRNVPVSEASAVAQALSNQLVQLIELHTLEARRTGGKAAMESEGDARFLKAALADELLLSTDWAGREHWHHVLLEANLFRSSQAGEKVFQDIEGILTAREPSQRNLARLYLYALSLGFQGRYRGSGALGSIAEFRRELYQFIYQRAPDLQGRDKTLSERAYASTLSYLASRRLPRLSRWWVVLSLVLLGLLAMSELLWLWQSWPVRRSLSSTVAITAPAMTTHLAQAGEEPTC
jgi:type VI secretion system protein ImpK